MLISSISCSAKNHFGLKAEGYIISGENDKESEAFAEYAFSELQQHTNQKDIVIHQTLVGNKNFKLIHFEVNPNTTNDYCILNSKDTLRITIKNKHDKTWMVSQLVEEVSKTDDRFKSRDLPPATIKFTTHCNDFDFSYRDPHYANNLTPGNSSVLGNNNVDLDWGIWGHNLVKVMKDVNDTNIYALVDKVRNKNQFSFSSTELFDHLKEYILDNFGDGEEKSYHFMIMPQDNNLVCMCEECKKIGNTKNNATPAVTAFIQKMAIQFPKHQFFTSSYNTTTELPKEKLSDNIGVFMSTIALKKGVELNMKQDKTVNFIEELNLWKNITKNIYIWDYSANFDDYLSPIPVLYGLQKQLKFYKEQGVKGVFLNASGYDYSSFGDLKSFVSGELLKNTNANVDQLCSLFFKKYYPQNHVLLTDYYLSLEKSFAAKNKSYNLYAGIDEILSSYLEVNEFIKFYKAIEKAISNTKKEEKEKLEKLYTALTYTKLQIAYNKVTGIHGCADLIGHELVIKPEIKKDIISLRKFSKYSNFKSYKEADGDLNKYIDIWKNTILNKRFENLLYNKTIEVISEMDEGFENSKYLNNGLPGFENDYHKGWYISSQDLKVKFSVENINETKRIYFRFMNNEKHGFYPPEKIEIWGDNKLIATIENDEYDTTLEAIELSSTLELSNIKNIQILFKRKPLKKSKVALDEIRILN